jgi:hypothetical protein
MRLSECSVIAALPLVVFACSDSTNGSTLQSTPMSRAVITGPSPLAASASASPAITTQASTNLAVQANSQTTIYVQVMPEASCALYAGDPSQAMRLFANDSGVVHFNVTPTREDTGTLFLDCAVGSGTLQRYPLQVTATTDPVATAASLASLATLQSLSKSNNGTPRPALTGDPMSYAPGDLLLAGYGPRPDPVHQPTTYAAWLQSVRTPGTIVSGRSVAGDSTNGPNENRHFSLLTPGGGWSGAVDSLISAPMANVFATFNVPQVFAESSVGNFSSASSWAGLGGSSSSLLPLWQTGVEK